MSAAIGGGSGRLSCSTLAGCAVDPEIEGQLTAARREQVAEHRAEARAAPPAPRRPDGRPPDRRRRRTIRRARDARTDQSPLLHVAQMILAHVLVALEELTPRDGEPVQATPRAFTIIQLDDPGGRSWRNQDAARSVRARRSDGHGRSSRTPTRRTSSTASPPFSTRSPATSASRSRSRPPLSASPDPSSIRRARLTNILWDCQCDADRPHVWTRAHVALLNDLEAMATASTSLDGDELVDAAARQSRNATATRLSSPRAPDSARRISTA